MKGDTRRWSRDVHGSVQKRGRRSSGQALWAWLLCLCLIVAAVAALSVFEVNWLWQDASWKPVLLAITILRHLIELLCIVYAMCFVTAAVRYVRMTWPGARSNDQHDDDVDQRGRSYPPLAVIYLCCNDLEEQAVRSLSRLKYNGDLIFLIHDDSVNPDEQRRVDQCVRRMEAQEGVTWRVLRRTDKAGGKPGAMQYIFDKTAHEHDFFLLCDNDSYIEDTTILQRAMSEFDDPKIAAVQCRNRTRISEEDGAFARCVAGAIDIFDAFATGLFDRLWRPFVGHNAVLRTQAVLDAGGFTPGFFADDIDLTVRLNLQGKRVVYRRDLAMAECHPSNYRSFSLRSKKWAHGCAQILRTHLLSVLGSDRITLREKFGFLLFTGFYVTQVAMLLYIVLIFLILPILIGPTWTAAWWALTLGTIVPLSIFLPVVAYLCTEGRHLPFFRTLGSCAATYGSTDLWTILGLSGGFSRKQQRWIPTNSVLNGDRPLLDWSHFAFGSLVLLVPLMFQPELLLFPLTWLFAAKFLFVPAVAVHYSPAEPAVEEEDAPMPAPAPALQREAATATTTTTILAAVVVASFAVTDVAWADEAESAASNSDLPSHIRIEIDGEQILIDGEPTIIRGIHYGPWRPGTGPGRGFDYPGDHELRPDLTMIRSLHANTIHVYDPPPRLLDLAEEFDLNVFYVFNIEWWRLRSENEEDLDELVEDIVERLERMHEHPAVVAWKLGNEMPGWVIDELGMDGVRDFLGDLRERVREIDPYRPVTYGNWPLHRTLGIDRDMDIVSYNVYPFYPTEVAVSGFGNFIRDQIVPQAAGRPLIISEFGINTIEATPEQQAEVVVRCWWDLLDAGAQGGVVFAFADEWWKNYDNPIRPPDWWRRKEAPDDHLTHNMDPEEHYGIVNSYRMPKPAFEAVREMFAETRDGTRRIAGFSLTLRNALWTIGVVSVLGLIAVAAWLRLRGPESASN